MVYARNIEKSLMDWKQSNYRKPLVLRGARQVGKTTAIHLFAKQFKQYIALNLETTDAEWFRGEKDIHQLVDRLFFEKQLLKEEYDTLIFIDEIQEVPEALNMLRYFYENYPQYCVIAAGSLLESLFDTKVSFPVGRVDYLYMYPFNFAEFLAAIGETIALQAYRTIPVPTYAEDRLLRLFKIYALVGGMPEAVSRYADTHDLVQLNPVFDSLLVSYIDDVEKYTNSSSQIDVMRHCVRACFTEAGSRIKFAGFGNSSFPSRSVSTSLKTLTKALLIHLTYPTTQLTNPFFPDYKRSPRLQVLDTGMLNYFSGVQQEAFMSDDLTNVYKGQLIEHLVGQELTSISDNFLEPLHFWVREKKGSNAEIDYLLPTPNGMIPIEVKSGAIGHLKSLIQYMETSSATLAVRLYAGTYKVDNLTTPGGKSFRLVNLSYALTAQLPQYIAYLQQKNY